MEELVLQKKVVCQIKTGNVLMSLCGGEFKGEHAPVKCVVEYLTKKLETKIPVRSADTFFYFRVPEEEMQRAVFANGILTVNKYEWVIISDKNE